MLDVLVARPDNFHRPIDLLCDRRRLRDKVDFQLPAEAVSEPVIVDNDLVRRKPRYFAPPRLEIGPNQGRATTEN